VGKGSWMLCQKGEVKLIPSYNLVAMFVSEVRAVV